MGKGNILSISYDRVIDYEEIVLTVDNCEEYGYVATTTTIDGVEYIVFYKQGDNEEDYVTPEIEESVATTTIKLDITKSYSYIAPPCSKFKINYADVDKEGSGRNALTGQMVRERIGSYISIDLGWDLIPNSDTYNKWYKVLTSLPPSFNVELLMPTGEIETKEMYRGDVSTDLYLYYKDRQMWRGLSTTFIQFNVDEYDDSKDPEVELEEEIVYEGIKLKVYKDTADSQLVKEIYDWQLDIYLMNGWFLLG